MEANPLDPIKQQVNAGDQRGARLALLELLEAQPDNTDAWALLAILLTDPAEQARCYREILRIAPGDSQAAAWLASLTSQAAKQPAGGQSPGAEPPSERDNSQQILEDVVLPDPDDRIPQTPLGREAAQWQTEPQGFLDGLLDRLRGRTPSRALEAEAQVWSQEEAKSAAGALSPELILRLAGGPLAPEERRNCPKCNAVVSRREAKCPWCSAVLPELEDLE